MPNKPGDCIWLPKMLPPPNVGVLVGPNKLPVMGVPNPGVCDAVAPNMVFPNGLAAVCPKPKAPDAGVCPKPPVVLPKMDGAVPGAKADADVAKLNVDGELPKGEGLAPNCAAVLPNAGAGCCCPKRDGLLAAALLPPKTDEVCPLKRELVVDPKPPAVCPNPGAEPKVPNAADPG